MIAAIDTETQGLNAQAYILGCILTDEHTKPQYYTNKQDLWQRLKKLGQSQQKRKKQLNVYAHNMEYDFYAIADLNDNNIHIYSTKPFIASYKQNNKEIIKFYDTMGIYPMSLKKVGELIKLPKLTTPKELLTNKKTKITKELLQKIKPYLLRDTEIVLKSITTIKKRTKRENVTIKNHCTINQIAINTLMQKLRKKTGTEHFFQNIPKNETWKTLNNNKIHQAYRAGRNQAFQIGTHQNVTSIDINNLYGYAASTMKFPNLTTEKLTYNPTTTPQSFDKIGISEIMITNNNDTLGTLPVRTGNTTYYPTIGKTIIGTYTHQEIQQAIQNGWTIQQIHWQITYQQTHNIIQDIYAEYNKKRETADQYGKWYYKQLVNRSIGKMAQHQNHQEYIIDDIENAKEYLQRNYEICGNKKYKMLYMKETTPQPKPYYTPIIPTLINAQARVILNTHLQKIPQQNLIYTDTDSIIFTGNHLNKYTISKHYGDFKIEKQNVPIIIYSRKNYMIDQTIKTAGISKNFTNKKDFLKGKIHHKKMNTIKSNVIQKAGTFENKTTDLVTMQENYKTAQQLLQEPTLYIDQQVTDITPYNTNVIQLHNNT